MGRRFAVVLVLALATAGCVGSQGDNEEEAATTGGASATFPSPVYDQRHVDLGAAPIGSAAGTPCQTEASTCFSYPFDAGTDTMMQARLDWTDETNDFDLHVFSSESELVASSSEAPPGTTERLDAELAPGSYELVVAAWAVQEDTYTLEAQFGYP